MTVETRECVGYYGSMAIIITNIELYCCYFFESKINTLKTHEYVFLELVLHERERERRPGPYHNQVRRCVPRDEHSFDVRDHKRC